MYLEKWFNTAVSRLAPVVVYLVLVFSDCHPEGLSVLNQCRPPVLCLQVTTRVMRMMSR
jgi:hypothetical protein